MEKFDHYIKTKDNISLYSETFGKQGNEPCLLIAGAGAPCRFWTDSFCDSFAKKDFFVIRYDHRDVGLSSAVDFEKKPYDLQDLAADAIAILDFYEIEKAHLIGSSMGGFVAQWLAATSPERMKKLVAISTGPIGEVTNYHYQLMSQQRALSEGIWKQLVTNRPSPHFEESIDGYLKMWRLLNGELDLDEKIAMDYTRDLYFRSNHPPVFPQSYIKVIEKTLSSLKKRTPLLDAIKAPTLVIHGKSDSLMFPQISGIPLALALSGAELQLIPKMGHMMFNRALEEDIASRILFFLNSRK